VNKWSLALGVVLTIWGLLVILNPRYYHPIYRRFFDFSGYELLFGAALIFVGIFFVWTTLQRTQDKGEGQ